MHSRGETFQHDKPSALLGAQELQVAAAKIVRPGDIWIKPFDDRGKAAALGILVEVIGHDADHREALAQLKAQRRVCNLTVDHAQHVFYRLQPMSEAVLSAQARAAASSSF